MDNLIFLDTETTGNVEPRAVQVAFLAPSDGCDTQIEQSNFKPPKPIETAAMATHHITNKMVDALDQFEGSLFKTLLADHLQKRIFVAHNAPFDIGVLANEGLKVNWYIDTLRVARHILPDRESYALQFLRYDLKFELEAPAHDARGDVAVLEALFKHLLSVLAYYYKLESYQDQIVRMVELTKTPVTLSKANFGKHKGKEWQAIARTDPDYIKWLWNAEGDKPGAEQNEDLIFTLSKLIK